MKNYYEILGIDPDCTTEEVERAYREVALKYAKGKITYKQLQEANEMYYVLSDKIRREIYDERLNDELMKEAFANYKKALIERANELIKETKSLLSELENKVSTNVKEKTLSQIKDLEEAIKIGNTDQIKIKKDELSKTTDLLAKKLQQIKEETEKEANKKEEKEEDKDKKLKFYRAGFRVLSGAIALTTAAFIGFGIGSCSKRNNNSNQVEKENAAIIEIVKKPLVLTAENFDKVVKEIITENHSKGLDIKEDLVRSALLITNLNNLSDEDLAKLADGVNMQEELQNFLNYISIVETHNLTKNNVNFYTLAYDELDREMLKTLDQNYKSLIVTINNSNLDQEEKNNRIYDIINNAYEFTIGSGELKTETGEYSKLNLNPGAGLLAESYVNLIANEVRNVTGKQYKNEIDAIAENTNGLSYINAIYQTEIPCVEQEKTLTK